MYEYHTIRVNGLDFYVHFIECFCEILIGGVIDFFLEKDLGVTIIADMKVSEQKVIKLFG